MRIPVILADHPTGTLTGLYIAGSAVALVLICLLGVGAMSLTKRRGAVRGWLIAAGICVVLCIVSCIIVSVLGLA